MEKLVPHSINIKELLSAGKYTPVSVLGIEGGENLDTTFTREQFDKLSENELSRVYDPIDSVLKSANMTLDDVTWVEVIGGGVRVPSVQNILREKLGNKLGVHMNGDDSMAFGAAFIAANHSSNFRLNQKIELYHGNTYEILLKLKNINATENQTICSETQEDLAFDCIRPLNKSALLYKIRHGYDIVKTVSLRHDGDFEVYSYDRFPGEEARLLTRYDVTGVQDSLQTLKENNISDKPKVHLRFKLGRNGLLSLAVNFYLNIL